MENKVFKRILSLAMVVFMVASMLPTNVLAAEETLPEGYCPECKEVHEWVVFDAATHLDANRYITPGYYKLGADVTLTAANSYQADGTTRDPSVSTADIKIADGTKVCLDLAGHSIAVTNYKADTSSAVGRYSRAITNEGTLSILDSVGGGAIKNGRIGSRVPSSYGNGGNILNTGTLNLYSGTISGGIAYARVYNAGALGGNIANEAGSVFNMYGGTVSNGQTSSSSFNYDADSKNAHQGGGNIYSAGEVNIFGGTISGGVVSGSYSRSSSGAYGFYSKGGNIFMHTGTFNMTGGTITGGKINRSFTFKNDTNNAKASAYCYGGNLYAINTDVAISNATITDGSITPTVKGESDSTSSYAAAAYAYGGNIYVYGDDNHTKVTITDTTISGGVANAAVDYADTTVTNNHGKGLYVNNIGGNIYLTRVARATIDGNTVISGGSCAGSTATADKTHQGFGGNIHSNRILDIKGNTQILNGVANDNPGGNIYLGNYSNCILSENAKVVGGIGNGNSGGGNIYITGVNSMLTINDDAEVSGGSARGGGNIYANADSKVYINGGTVKDGISTWNEEDLYWAGGNLLVFNGASAIIAGGTISGGTANKFFHSVGIRGEGKIDVLGGQILGTDAENDLPLIGELSPNSGYGVFVYNAKVADDPAAFAVDCTCIKDNGDGTYTVWQPNVDENGLCETCGHTFAETKCSACYKIHVPAGGEHTWGETEVLLAPTCVTAGSGKHICQICGLEETIELAPTGEHTFVTYESDGNATCETDGTKTAKCAYCEETDTVTDVDSHLTVAHTYGPMEDGKQTCEICGHENACVHEYGSVVTKPTCTAQGYTTHTCSKCGDIYTDTYTDPIDHVYTEYVSNGDATCTADGTKTATCDTCGIAQDTVADTGSMLDHNYGQWEEGVKTCGDCGATLICQHPETELTGYVKNTCLAAGYSGDYVCTECGVTTEKGAATEQLSHEYDQETGICKNGCNVLAEAKVTLGEEVTYYTKAIDALVAADGTGATVLILKTTTVTLKNYFPETAPLNNVTIATAEGVTLKDNSGTSSGVYFLSGITFAKDSKFSLNGYAKFIGEESHIYADNYFYMTTLNTEVYIHGEEGAKVETDRNIWINGKVTVTGNSPDQVVMELNTHVNSYSLYADGGELIVENAKIICDSFSWYQKSTKATLTNANVVCDTLIINGKCTIDMQGTSNITATTSATYTSGKLTMSADSTITTPTADLQNVAFFAAEGIDGCVYYAEGTYTVSEHTFGEGVVTGATCTTDGYTTYTCSNCEYDKVEAGDKAGHTGLKHVEAKAPTCTDIGWNAYDYCEDCDYTTYEELPVDKDNHTNLKQEEAKAPTCDAIGWEAYEHCDACGYSTYVEIAAGHTGLKHVEAKAPTCTEIGWNAYDYCEDCDYTTYEELPVDKDNHTNLKQEEAKAPTCTTVGWEAYEHCDACGYTTYEELPVDKDAHTNLKQEEAKAPTCDAIGWEAYEHCSACGYTTYVELPAAHTGLKHVEAKAPTCTEIGWNAYDYCEDCDYTTYEELPVDKDNHTNLKQEEAKAPTCTEDGWKAYEHCDACGYSTYEVDPKTGHSYTYTSNGDKATHTIGCEKGDYTATGDCTDENGDKLCDFCGQKLTDPVVIVYTVDGSKEFESLQEAINASEEGCEYQLQKDIVLTERLTIDKNAYIKLNGFSITGNFDDAFGMVYVKKGAYVSFNNGTIENAGGIAIGNYGFVELGAEATVTGADAALYNFYYQADYYGIATVNGKANVIWNCGNLTVDESAVVDYLDNSGAATISGTVTELYAQDGSDCPDVEGAGTLAISNTENVSVPDDYKLVEVETGVYKVVAKAYVAEVNGTKYETFAEAFAQGGEIKLLAELTLTEQLTVRGLLTIDLNGFNITGNVEGAYGMIYVAPNSNLGIMGEGTVKNDGGYAIGNYGFVVIHEGVTVEGADAALYNFYYNAQTYGSARVAGKLNVIWNCGTLNVEDTAEVAYLDNSGAATISGTVTELYAQDGSDCPALENAGTLKIADTSKVTLDEGFILWEVEEGVYKVHAHEHTESYTEPTTEKDGFWTYTCICGDSYTVIDENTRLHVNVPTVDAEDIKDNIETEGTEATTQDIQDVIDHVVHGNEAVIDKDVFVDDANDAVIEQMKQDKPELADKEPVLHITLQGMGVKTEEGMLVAHKLVFDVTPMLGDTKIENLQAPLTFHLPVDDSLTGNAYVYHEGEFMGVYAIVTENGHNYVIVSSQNFSEFTVEVQNVNDVAVNMTTGETYTDLQAALNAAARGETVKLMKDFEMDDLYVGSSKTLDLNGKKLTVNNALSASYTTTHIIDSSNGEGLLVVDGNVDVALNGKNSYLPVWTAEGVRFVTASFKELVTVVDENTTTYQFYLNMNSNDTILDEILANGSDGTGLVIRVKVTYTGASGMKATQYFELTSDMVESYVQRWDSIAAKLTVTGTAGRSNLEYSAEIVSTAPNGSSVVVDKVDN